MKNILKNKFLVIIFIFLSILFFVNVSYGSNALNTDFYYPNNINPFNINYDNRGNNVNQILYELNNNYYMLVWFVVDGTHENTSLYMSGIPCSTFINQSSGYNHCVLYKYNASNWEALNWWYSNFSTTLSESETAKSLIGANIVSSSANIYKNSELLEIFFYATPQVTIQEMAKVEELPQMMEKILQIIIPVGLVILSVGLLIYVIKSVILRVT